MMGTFKVLFLDEAVDFFDKLDDTSRRKVLYNMNKACKRNDGELLKKIHTNIWEFRTLYCTHHIRFFAFWDKKVKGKSQLIITHGIIKKTAKVPMHDIRKAEKMRRIFLNQMDALS